MCAWAQLGVTSEGVGGAIVQLLPPVARKGKQCFSMKLPLKKHLGTTVLYFLYVRTFMLWYRNCGNGYHSSHTGHWRGLCVRYVPILYTVMSEIHCKRWRVSSHLHLSTPDTLYTDIASSPGSPPRAMLMWTRKIRKGESLGSKIV